MNEHAPHPRAIRNGLLELIETQPFTHGLTLNADRTLSKDRIRSIFSTFCVKLDREIHGRRRVRKIPAGERFNAIAFPEHLETNAHLHVLADMSMLAPRYRDNAHFALAVRSWWLQSTHGAGSVHVEDGPSAGFARYSTKDLRGVDPLYFLSRDFHPR